ncbi:serine/threonine-protein kinase [Streptomyces sp. NPDC001177]
MTRGEQGAERLIASRYRVLRRLGAGGMGRVWLAFDESLQCEVALKELAVPEEIPESELSARIARARSEARHAAQLRNHPHVATVHDVVEVDGLPWIVMGYVPGAMDLREIVGQQGPLSPAETARIGLAVLDALMAGHRLGILHRDVKPANILLTMPDPQEHHVGQVLLTDYGISLQPESGEPRVTGTSGFIGTPGFLAPERARGVPPNPASDLFSLGATLYYAVEGIGPFERTSEVSTLTALLFEDPPPPIRAGALEPLLTGLMAKDPEKRTGAEEAKHRFAELIAVPLAARQEEESAARETYVLPPLEDRPASQLPFEPLSAPVVTSAEAGPSQPPRSWRSRVSSGRHLALIAAVLLIIGGGIWAGFAMVNGTPTQNAKSGPVLPYGSEVGLAHELHLGDCVSAAWPAERFKGLPQLKVVDCKNAPDGQVLDANASSSLTDAKTNGPGICTGLLRDTVRKMVDVQPFALEPSGAGWDHGVRNTACILFGKTVGLYGPVGHYRHYGDEVFVENSSIGDCFNTKKVAEHDISFFLADCSKPHDQQALGYVKAPQSMKWDAWDGMTKLCSQRYGTYRNPNRDLWSRNDGAETWSQGFRFVMCAIWAGQGGKKLPPGSALATSAQR